MLEGVVLYQPSSLGFPLPNPLAVETSVDTMSISQRPGGRFWESWSMTMCSDPLKWQ